MTSSSIPRKSSLSQSILLVAALVISLSGPVHAQVDIFTAAGTGSAGFNGEGGPATAAMISSPLGIGVDGAGNVYFADLGNNRVRKIDTSGIITTAAGTGNIGFSGDGALATAAELDQPFTVAVDGAGNIYFSDRGNRRVRKIDTAGIITTVAGSGQNPSPVIDGIFATDAALDSPRAISVDSTGVIYFHDDGVNLIFKVDAAGIITKVAGNGSLAAIGDPAGDAGLATAADLGLPHGIFVDGAGDLFIADSQIHRIRMVDGATGIISTIAGSTPGFAGDGGPATTARFRSPRGVSGDSSGNIYIADYNSHRIRKIDTGGIISTIAGTGVGDYNGDGRVPTMADLKNPLGVAVDSSGIIYISDQNNHRIRKITPATLNNAPSDLNLSNDTIPAAAGANSLVGVLTTTDADAGDSHLYTKAAGNGDTDNALFTITGSQLRVIDPSVLNGVYSVRIQTNDQVDGTFVKAFSITVTVPDTVPPVITVTGTNPQIITTGDAYVELGATAADDVDGDLTASIVTDSSAVNTAVAGNYTVTYNVMDAAGNAATQATRTVTVQDPPPPDTTPPVITVTGANPQIITTGNAYTELGATAADDVDGDLTASIVPDSSAVNTAVAGSYTVTYNVMDAAGNAATEATRTVTVQDPPVTPPPAPRSSGGCSIGPSDGMIDPTLPILMLISLVYMLRRRLSEI